MRGLAADHRHAVDRGGNPAAPGRHEDGVHGAVGTFDVIAAQVAGVAEDAFDHPAGFVPAVPVGHSPRAFFIPPPFPFQQGTPWPPVRLTRRFKWDRITYKY